MGRMGFSTRGSALLGLFTCVAFAAGAPARTGEPDAQAPAETREPGRTAPPHGPFPVRNLFPLHLPFLALGGEAAELVEPGEWSLRADYAISNTFAAGPGLLETLRLRNERGSPNRDALLARIAEAPDTFLVDLEVERLSLTLRRGITRRWELGLEVPIVSSGGGVLDGFIEGFHDFFSLGQADRDRVARGSSVVAIPLAGAARVLDDVRGVGLGDVSLRAKIRLFGHPSRPGWRAAARLAVEFPAGSVRGLRGNGRIDTGAALDVERRGRRHRTVLSFAATRPGGWDLAPAVRPAPGFAVVAAWEVEVRPGLYFVVQDMFHRSPLRGWTASELTRPSHEATAGLRLYVGRGWWWALSITENYLAFNNSPDVGFHSALSRRWGGR